MRSIEARVARTRAGTLSLTYTASGLIDRLRVPAPRAPHIAERLWEHTCFEVFIRVKGETAYHELNFAPSGAWAAFAFGRYREGAVLAGAALAPGIVVRRDAETLTLDATVDLTRLSPRHAGAALALGLSAVIEDQDGTLSYWALGHPPGKPDFHHPDACALELDAARD